jgi:hypothetical protein
MTELAFEEVGQILVSPVVVSVNLPFRLFAFRTAFMFLVGRFVFKALEALVAKVIDSQKPTDVCY